MRGIYLDHAATTYVDNEVLSKMMPYFSDTFGNASSQHSFGQDAAKAVIQAREKIAEIFNCNANEIYFTSGGTESDNWALKGYAHANKNKGNHIITTKIEHHAILDTCKFLEKEGFRVTYLDVDKEGFISLDELKNSICDETILISIMFANNEIGTVQDIKAIGQIAREKRIAFHTDAVQAVGDRIIDVKDMNIDMLSLSGHKFYGPKGIGILYKRNGIKIEKFMSGGEQEKNMRGGTTNTPGIIGLATALDIAYKNFNKNCEYISSLRNHFVKRVLSEIDHSYLNGPALDSGNRLSNNANISFEYIEGESILFKLDLQGVCVSSGSACSSGSLDPSHVLLAIGVPVELAHGSIRFTFGKSNTMEDVDRAVDILKNVVGVLRKMSPLL